MREIKFRACNKKDKCWLNPRQIMINLFGDRIISTLGDLDKEDLKLMQFTGLKDKNGKEIYEGDILEADSSYHVWGRPKDNSFIGIVEFQSKKGYFCSFNKTTRNDIDEVHIKVIGNIYENKDLL